tara:strand:- start:763 stop:1233 length:471 start_codon:yes stop_codon:yes gene_type:complete
MTRKINNSYLLGQSNAPTTGGDMLKTRTDGTPVWEEVDGTTYVPVYWYGERGIFAAGKTSSDGDNYIEYITIASTGNASDFGDLTVNRWTPDACSSGSRGLIGGGGGDAGERHNVIDYITISTTGNATDFGDLTDARRGIASTSSNVRGIFAGGND